MKRTVFGEVMILCLFFVGTLTPNPEKPSGKLPATVKLPMRFQALVYPSAGDAVGVIVQGTGYFTLKLDPTANREIARATLKDILVNLKPAHIPFDTNKDGKLETIELKGLELDTSDFDLKKSGGEYNLLSRQISLNFVFVIRPARLGALASVLRLPDIRFSLKEQGWLDLESRKFKTHSFVWSIPEGPLSGLTILGGQTGEIGGEGCQSTVAIGGLVLSSVSSSITISAGQAPNTIYICPNTPIAILWESTNASGVTINPDLGSLPVKGYQVLPDASSSNPNLQKAVDRNLVYVAKTQSDDCDPASDQLTVNVVNNGDIISQTATYNPEFKYWIAELPQHTYDKNIKVTRVIIDSGKSDSVTHPNWRLDHVFPTESPVGMNLSSLNTWKSSPTSFSLPGEYRFTAMPMGTTLPSGEEKRIIYFRVTVECQKQ